MESAEPSLQHSNTPFGAGWGPFILEITIRCSMFTPAGGREVELSGNRWK
jgi:hypothetical protein